MSLSSEGKITVWTVMPMEWQSAPVWSWRKEGYRISEKASIVHHVQQNDLKRRGRPWKWRALKHESKALYVKYNCRALKKKPCLIWFPPVWLRLLPVCFKHLCRDSEAAWEIFRCPGVFIQGKASFTSSVCVSVCQEFYKAPETPRLLMLMEVKVVI